MLRKNSPSKKKPTNGKSVKPTNNRNTKSIVKANYKYGEDEDPTDNKPLMFKINGSYKNEKQKSFCKLIEANRIIFCKGSPGTGKTYLAIKTGLELLKKGEIGEIILTKPIVEVGKKNIGALPGDVGEKISIHFEHFYDNFEKLVGKETTDYLRKKNIIKEKIVNFMRGATLGSYDKDGNPIGSFCIADEFQNNTVMEMKTFISRLGEKSKMVILGDSDQIDVSFNSSLR